MFTRLRTIEKRIEKSSAVVELGGRIATAAGAIAEVGIENTPCSE